MSILPIFGLRYSRISDMDLLGPAALTLNILLVIGPIYLLFKILDGIRKSNHERNALLRDIHEELRKQNLDKE